jgi:hypothetical protein
MPADTDYWINDRSGDPLLVVTGEVDAALTKAPRLLSASCSLSRAWSRAGLANRLLAHPQPVRDRPVAHPLAFRASETSASGPWSANDFSPRNRLCQEV